MLNIQDVANFLNSELNAVSEKHQFNIMAEVGKNKNNNKINGIIRNVGGEVVARSGFVGAEYNFAVELSVPCGNSNINLINVEQALNSLIVSKNATLQVFGDGKGVITINYANPRDFRIDYGVGDTVPLVFSVRIEYTESGVLGVEKHWLLNDVEIPFLMEQVSVVREGKTSKVADGEEVYNKTLMTAQTRQYKFSMKYDGGNEVCQNIQKDILNGEFNKTYTLKYYDGVNFTEEQPFEHLVYMLPSGDSDGENAKISVLNVQFMDADDGITRNRYYLRPVNFPFADGDENTRFFGSKQAQIDYFNSNSREALPYVQIKAPNLESLQLMSQIYTGQGQEPSKLIQFNYAVLKIETYELSEGEWELQDTDYYYYWITSAVQGSETQVMYNLKMDTVQSFLFNGKVGKLPAFVEKAHLDRFIDNGDGTVSFNGEEDSPLFEREDVQGVAKRLIKRKSLGFQVDTTTNSALNAWLEKYIVGWDYYFLTGKGDGGAYTGAFQFYGKDNALKSFTLNVLDYDTYGATNKSTFFSKLSGVMRVICVPVYKDYGTFQLELGGVVGQEDRSIFLSTSGGIQGFIENNNGYSYVYARKFSKTPPFVKGDYTGKYTITENYTGTGLLQSTLKIGSTSATNDYYGVTGRAVGLATGAYNAGVPQNGVIVVSDGITQGFNLTDYNTVRPLTFGKVTDVEVPLDKFKFTTASNIASTIDTIKIFRPSKVLYPKIDVAIRFMYDNMDSGENFILDNIVGTTDTGTFGIVVRILKTYIEISVPYRSGATVITYPRESTLYGIVPHILQGSNTNPTPKNVLYNPKLLGADYAGLKLTNERGNGFEYDLQKLNKQTVKTLYTEPPVPDISRSYFRVTDTDGVYIDKCDENLTGFVDGADMSLMVDNTQLAQTLAENKNFFLQQTLSIVEPAMTGLVGGALAGGPAGLITGAIGAGVGAITGIINKNITIDNMRNAPNMIKNANGNAYFNVQYSEVGPIIEEYDILDNEKEIINDQMFKYGFNYNKLDDAMAYINKRKYFSYVKAHIDQLQTSDGTPSKLNNVARLDLIQRFADGIRFWQDDIVQYEYENYEKSLE